MINKIAPSSKSVFQREIIASLITQGVSELNFNFIADDVLSCIEAAKSFCDKIKLLDNKLIIDAQELALTKNEINFRESGFALRALTPLLATFGKLRITGENTLLTRDMSSLIEVLEKLHLIIDSHNKKIPIDINGEVNFEISKLNFSDTSQVISGLIFLFAYHNLKSKINIIKEVKSKGYLDLTLQSLYKRNFNIINNDYKEFLFTTSEFRSINTTIEGCYSSASFWIIYGAIKEAVTISNLLPDSLQPDKKLLELIKTNANLEFNNNDLTVYPRGHNCFIYNAENTPDLIPNLCIYAAFCNGSSEIFGIHRLINKESNRAEAILSEFPKMGIKITKTDNDSFIISNSEIISADLNSFNDHRLAIAYLLAEKLSDKKMIISNTKCISKSAPIEFFE